MATPHVILLGYGVTDSLQLTVEAQRVLSRYGAAYSIGLPANLGTFLKSQRVKVTDLSSRLRAGSEAADGYLEVAHFLIERTASERPVILLAPGNPLMFNAIGRYLAMEGQRLGLSLQALAGISPLDLILAGIGLDVSTFGLQVFDATQLMKRRPGLNPEVPLVLMHLGAFAEQSGPAIEALEQLGRHLLGCYPPEHVAVHVVLEQSGMTVRGTNLGERAALEATLSSGSHLFIDAVRQQRTGTPA